MKIERKQLFEQLDPPAGGIERLQRKMKDSAAGSSSYLWQPVMAAAMLLLVVTLSLRWSSAPPKIATPMAQDLFNAVQFDRLLGRPPAAVKLLVMRADQAVPLVELEGTKANIRVYRLNPGS